MSLQRHIGLFLFHALLVSLTACAPTLPPVPLSGKSPADFAWLQQVDRAVARAECANQAAYPVPGLPMLRISRFWAAFDSVKLNTEAFRFWVERLRGLDRQAREAELACLPDEVQSRLAAQAGGRADELATITEDTADRLLAEQMENPLPLRKRLAKVEVPDDYRLWMRTVGLYPLVRIPFSLAVANAYADRREWYRRDLTTFLAAGSWKTFRPSASLSAGEEIDLLLKQSADNPLRVPLPSLAAAEQMAKAFAPILVQQTSGSADRWGEVEGGRERPRIRGEKPTVYFYLDHGFWRGEAFLRINYVFWYPRRNGESTPWFEDGFLDGITIGISLDRNGRPFLLQTMNNCGCYLQYFPTSGLIQRPVSLGPDPLIPQVLPENGEGKRLEVFINSGWHQVLRLASTGNPLPTAGSYELVPYGNLERLPLPGGGFRSLFDSAGIVPGTERPERYFFFSMGIPSVGSMRQRGHQPVSLLEREHYDDPHLIEETFQDSRPKRQE